MVLQQKISNWLSDYLIQSGLECFVVGISGGIDSALVSTLSAMSGKKTILLSMPIHQPSEQLRLAHEHAAWLKKNYPSVESLEYDLTQTFESFKSLFDQEAALALANSRARLRMTTLYQVAAMEKGLVVGTGNRVEDFGVGFFTKYGDGGVDLSPIADLTKTEVRELAKKLGIIEDILKAKPTDGLWADDRSDEDQIGATYEELEWAMDFSGDPLSLQGREKEVLSIYSRLNKQNAHKTLPIPIFKK